MAQYDYVEKAVKVSRREFLGLAGVAGAMLWTGAYVATDLIQDRTRYIKMRAQGIIRTTKKPKFGKVTIIRGYRICMRSLHKTLSAPCQRNYFILSISTGLT